MRYDGLKIKRARLAAGFNLRELARAARISEATLHRIEKEHRTYTTTPRTASKLARVLGCELGDFINEEEVTA